MSIVLAVFGVAFAAAGIWGVVRLVNEPKRSWLFITRPLTPGSVVGVFMAGIGLLLLLPDFVPAVQPSHPSGVAPWGFYSLIVGIAFVVLAQPQE